MKRAVLASVARISGACVAIVAVIGLAVAQPSFRTNPKAAISVDPTRLKAHVQALTEDFYPRNWRTVENLDQCAKYIRGEFDRAGARTEEQVFACGTSLYRNVIARFGPQEGQRLILGAHYDSHEDTPGADDNASAVAVLIELAHLLGKTELHRPLELVAYTLEEPPFFRTPLMGSAVHARSLGARGQEVLGVVIFEMVGYFRDEAFSQSYPSGLLYLIYPSRGNFLGVIGKWDQGAWIKRIKMGLKGRTDLPVWSIRAPRMLPGIDFSDHVNYWDMGYPAVMLTDTAFYRNKAYHSTQDTMDTLDYQRMSEVVISAHEMAKDL